MHRLRPRPVLPPRDSDDVANTAASYQLTARFFSLDEVQLQAERAEVAERRRRRAASVAATTAGQ